MTFTEGKKRRHYRELKNPFDYLQLMAKDKNQRFNSNYIL